ncbi:hypothetical protein AKO1_005917 [Acrasis kona]|uniref:Uncharacterized protein n=1 Tax=Acrasis kona TaxID=1008807 RepID=A0AAW2YIK5_9EUKA
MNQLITSEDGLNNTYVRKSAADLLICSIQCDPSEEYLKRIDKELISSLSNNHLFCFIELCYYLLSERDNTIKTNNVNKKRAIESLLESLNVVEHIVEIISKNFEQDQSASRKRAIDILVMLSDSNTDFDCSIILEHFIINKAQLNWWEHNHLSDLELCLNLLQSLNQKWLIGHSKDINRIELVKSLQKMWRLMLVIIEDDQSTVEAIQNIHVMKRGRLIEHIVKCFINIWSCLQSTREVLIDSIVPYISSTLNEYRHSNDSLCTQALKLLLLLFEHDPKNTYQNVTKAGLDVFVNRIFSSSNNSQLYNLCASIVGLFSKDSIAYRQMLVKRLYDINWEIRDTSLQLIKHGIETNLFPIDDLTVNTILNRMCDAEPFVRLRAIGVMDDLIIYNKINDIPLIKLLDSTQQCVDFYVHEAVMKTLTRWMIDGVLSWSVFNETAVEHVSRIADRAYNEFDYELMRHLLEFYSNAVLCSKNLSTLEKLTLMKNLHIDVIITDLIQGVVTAGRVHDALLDKICNKFLNQTVLDESLSDLVNQLSKFKMYYPESKQDKVVDVVDFFTMREEGYDCY